MQSPEVVVSVVMTTYNHEAFLAEAIESVLRQRTTFRYEIVIGEDCSTDRTLELAQRYAANHPDIVRIVRSERNVGWRANYRRTIAAAKGRYIALLDGDDMFIDDEKLQRQVELLEADTTLGMCYTRSIRRDERGNETIYPEGPCHTSFDEMLPRRELHRSSPPRPCGAVLLGDSPRPTRRVAYRRPTYVVVVCRHEPLRRHR